MKHHFGKIVIVTLLSICNVVAQGNKSNLDTAGLKLYLKQITIENTSNNIKNTPQIISKQQLKNNKTLFFINKKIHTKPPIPISDIIEKRKLTIIRNDLNIYNFEQAVSKSDSLKIIRFLRKNVAFNLIILFY